MGTLKSEPSVGTQSSRQVTMKRLCHRKKRRREPSENTTEESVAKYKDTRGKLRRRKVQNRLNLRKRHPPTRAETKRKTKFECVFLPLAKEHWDEIISGTKKFEFRRKNTKVHVRQIGDVHHFLKYIIFWLRSAKPPQYMLIEFNGLDYSHEKTNTHYCMRLGNILSTDTDKIHELGYNYW